MPRDEEATHLLPNEEIIEEEIEIASPKRSQIFGGLLAVSAGFTFTWYSYFIKKLGVDVTDVVFLRAVFQISIFGVLSTYFRQSFLPDRSLYDTRKQYGFQCFLLLFQV